MTESLLEGKNTQREITHEKASGQERSRTFEKPRHHGAEATVKRSGRESRNGGQASSRGTLEVMMEWRCHPRSSGGHGKDFSREVAWSSLYSLLSEESPSLWLCLENELKEGWNRNGERRPS